jgi:hypothetical protein
MARHLKLHEEATHRYPKILSVVEKGDQTKEVIESLLREPFREGPCQE